MPVWKKIAWNPTVANSTLEELLEAADPSDYVKEMIKQKIMAREAGEGELEFHELRRRVISSRHPESGVGLAADDGLLAALRKAVETEEEDRNLQESKVFARWQKIIN